MTDSTKLELDEDYYLKLKNGKIEKQKFIGGFVLRNDDEIAEVLGKVPSYELWKAVHEQWKVLLEENEQLKELLKECVPFVELCNYTPENRRLLKSINELIGEE